MSFRIHTYLYAQYLPWPLALTQRALYIYSAQAHRKFGCSGEWCRAGNTATSCQSKLGKCLAFMDWNPE